MSIQIGSVINQKYQLTKKVGSGSFGEIFAGVGPEPDTQVGSRLPCDNLQRMGSNATANLCPTTSRLMRRGRVEGMADGGTDRPLESAAWRSWSLALLLARGRGACREEIGACQCSVARALVLAAGDGGVGGEHRGGGEGGSAPLATRRGARGSGSHVRMRARERICACVLVSHTSRAVAAARVVVFDCRVIALRAAVSAHRPPPR